MTEFLRNLTMSLSGIIVFGSLCEMLLPNSVYKKYVNLTIGLMLCTALISPFIKESPGLSFNIPSVDAASSEVIEQDRVIAVYSKRLCESIEAELKKETDLEIDVKCRVSDSEESYGAIEEIYFIADGNDGRRVDDALINKISGMYGTKNISVKYLK